MRRIQCEIIFDTGEPEGTPLKDMLMGEELGYEIFNVKVLRSKEIKNCGDIQDKKCPYYNDKLPQPKFIGVGYDYHHQMFFKKWLSDDEAIYECHTCKGQIKVSKQQDETIKIEKINQIFTKEEDIIPKGTVVKAYKNDYQDKESIGIVVDILKENCLKNNKGEYVNLIYIIDNYDKKYNSWGTGYYLESEFEVSTDKKDNEILDWKNLSSKYTLTDQEIIDHIDLIDINSICVKKAISLNILDKYHDKLDKKSWEVLASRYNLPEEFIFKYQDKLNLNAILENYNLSEDLIDKIISILKEKKLDINWSGISKQNISEDFIYKYQDRLNWLKISEKMNLSKDFIRKNKDRLLWFSISKHMDMNPEIDEDFVYEMRDYFDWNWVCEKFHLSEEFIEKLMKANVNLNWHKIFNNQIVSQEEDFREKYMKYYN